MFRLQSALTQADALAARFLSETKVRTKHTSVSRKCAPVTENCIPSRRRRTRRQLATGSGEPLRSTWF